MLSKLSCIAIACCAANVVSAQTQTRPVPVTPPKNPSSALAPRPPVKMGLWENKITTQIGGLELPPDVVAKLQAMGKPVPGATPRTMVLHACLTPGQWQKDMQRMTNPNDNCTTSNRKMTEKEWSFDLSCTSQQGMTMTGHFDLTTIDDEHTQGTAHMKAVNDGQTLTSDMTFETHRLGADCGDVQPGSPQVISDGTQ